MHGFNRISRLFLKGGMLAASALCLGACGNYAVYKLAVNTSPKSADGFSRGDIASCTVTITDENGGPVLTGYPFPGDSNTHGCTPGNTQEYIGTFSYSTARASGKLNFQVDAFNANKGTLQTGQTGLIAAQAFPPEVTIPTLTIK